MDDSLKITATAKESKNFDRVIIHVHGGGFVAQSSSSHQLYLNLWANEFKVPIFSIDYRLANKDTHFPTPLNDVITGYLWIINYLEFVLAVKPRQIVAVGDSAGGNLLCGLVAWCHLNKVRAPNDLILFYPAMSCNDEHFTPSFMFSLNDFMLNYSALRMCSLFYVSEGQQPSKNPFISPVLWYDEVLKGFPPV